MYKQQHEHKITSSFSGKKPQLYMHAKPKRMISLLSEGISDFLNSFVFPFNGYTFARNH